MSASERTNGNGFYIPQEPGKQQKGGVILLTKQEFEALSILNQRRYAEQQQNFWRRVNRTLTDKVIRDECTDQHAAEKCTTAIDDVFSATVPEEDG